MEFQDVVRRRKMVRSFEDRPIPHEIVERLLANAQRAPSAGFSQGWAFLVFEGRPETDRFWNVVNPRRAGAWPDLFNAPVVIACLAQPDVVLERYAEPDKGRPDRDERSWRVPYWDVDTGMAALLMLLTATDEGLGALFFGLPEPERFLQAFGVPGRAHVIGAIAFGYPKPHDRASRSLTRGRRPAAAVVHRGRW